MKAEHFVLGYMAFCRRKPFAPFLLQLMTGEMLLVKHPEAVRIRNLTALFVDSDGRQRIFDGDSVCQLLELPLNSAPNA